MLRLMANTPRSVLVLLVGCTVGALSFAVDARRSSRSPVIHREDEAGNDGAVGKAVVRDVLHGGGVRPAAIATWRFGEIAVDAARSVLKDGGTALDALEEGITAVELDTQDQYFVGLGGLPNTDGVMEFDAAVMDGKTMSYGAVMAIRGIVTAFSAARLVMDRSQHSVLAGEGATKFALDNEIEAAETLTHDAREQFGEWRRQQLQEAARKGGGADTDRMDRGESHDTVGMVCLDADGNLAAGTSTSGWKFKHPGRVGDAPVIGAGLYCDGRVGAAVATGDGEEILRTCLSFLVVEYMRAGDPPGLACRKGIERLEAVVNRPVADASSGNQELGMHERLTVAVMAMSPVGEIGAASTLGPNNVHRGKPTFPLAVWREGERVQVVEETDL